MLKQTSQETKTETPQTENQKIDYSQYEPYVEFDDKILGPAAEEAERIKTQIENLVDDLTDAIYKLKFDPEEKNKPIEAAPLKHLAEKGIVPDLLGKEQKKPSKFDGGVSQWCRDLNEKIPVAPLTPEEKTLLQTTLAVEGLTETDFVTMAIRKKLNSTETLHDDRRPLEGTAAEGNQRNVNFQLKQPQIESVE